MWANNEVGTVQPVADVVALAHAHDIPVHTDAVQAVGQVPVDFAASGVDALTLTAHKVGGPYGVGALVVRRDLDVTPQLHGGGQERDIRSGTIDTPAIAGFARAVELAVKHQAEHAARVGALRDALVARHPAAGAGRPAQRRPGHRARPPAARQRAPDVPRLRGRLAADAARRPRHRLLDRLGLLGRGAPALARAAGDGPRRRAGPQLAALLARATPAPRPTSTRSSRRSAPVVERARAAGVAAGFGDLEEGRLTVRVLAAMSGGVDSAVAAARAAEAGHDVTGIHLALSRNPQSYRTGARGCCTIEDSNDARRAADVIGIPFYVWDLSDRFHEDVVEDFMAEYSSGRTPNPCLRCNEKIKFAAVLDRAMALGFDAVATGHYAQLDTGDDGLIEMHRAVDMGKDQSYVLGVLTQEQLAHSLFPLGDSRKADGARRGGAPRPAGRPEAGQPRHLLHLRRRHRRLAAREARTGHPASRGARRPRERRGAGPPRRRVRVHHRAAQGPADRPARRRRPAALRPGHRAGLRHGDRRPPRGAHRRPHRGHQAALVRQRPRRAAARHRPAARPRRRAPCRGDGVARRRRGRGRAARPGAGHRPRPGRGGVRRHPRRRLLHDLLGLADAGSRHDAAPPASGRCPARTRRTTTWRCKVVLDELPDLPHVPELPGRGAHAT